MGEHLWTLSEYLPKNVAYAPENYWKSIQESSINLLLNELERRSSIFQDPWLASVVEYFHAINLEANHS